MINFEKRLPTFDTPMPSDPMDAAVIAAAEEVVAKCVTLYGLYAIQNDTSDDWKLLQVIGEDLATVDESLMEEVYLKKANQDDTERHEVQILLDNVQLVVEKRHIENPQLTEYRANILGSYRKKLLETLTDPQLADLDEHDALEQWEDLLERHPLIAIERAFDEAQISVEQDLMDLANPERGLPSS